MLFIKKKQFKKGTTMPCVHPKINQNWQPQPYLRKKKSPKMKSGRKNIIKPDLSLPLKKTPKQTNSKSFSDFLPTTIISPNTKRSLGLIALCSYFQMTNTVVQTFWTCIFWRFLMSILPNETLHRLLNSG